MPTLLLSRTCQPEARVLAAHARRAGWGVQWLQKRHGPVHLHGREFALYAETDIALRVAKLHGLALIEPTLDLLACFPHCYLRRQVDFMSLAEAENLAEPKFIKPADCTAKVFDAAVYKEGRFILREDELSPSTPVLAAEPVDWGIEYRVIVLERRVVAYSPYICGGWLARNAEGRWPYPADEAEQMLAFARRFLADDSIALPPAFVLDVGLIAARGWAVVEMNPAWCSGLLGCELNLMLPVLRRACRRGADLSCSDRRWVIDRPAMLK
jgi:hypothetical protein